MDEPVFDAMLKTALEEALEEDMKDREGTPPVRQSLRQRRRMRRMLADSWGYARRLRAAECLQEPRRHRNPARWLLVAVIAALLAGTAAGYALRGGAFFQQMFDSSPWAAEYGDAADTEQLLDMGGGNVGAVLEQNGLRFETLDVVSDGQYAMVSVRLTVPDGVIARLMETHAPGDLRFADWKIEREDGGETDVPPGRSTWGFSSQAWTGNEELQENQYLLIFSINDPEIADGGEFAVVLDNLGTHGPAGETYLQGPWTLHFTLPAGTLRQSRPGISCEIHGESYVLKRVSASALVLNLDFDGPEDGREELEALSEIMVNFRDGRSIGSGEYTCGITGGEDVRVMLEFQMPVDVDQIESITVCGQEIRIP